MALIMDCPMITVHVGKSYEALTDSGAAISLIRYSTYQTIDNSFKTTIQTTTTKLNMADGSLMMALGMTSLHLRIADLNSLIILLHVTGYWTQKYCLELISRKKIPCHLPGIRKRTATYKRTADFSLTLELVNRRQQ